MGHHLLCHGSIHLEESISGDPEVATQDLHHGKIVTGEKGISILADENNGNWKIDFKFRRGGNLAFKPKHEVIVLAAADRNTFNAGGGVKLQLRPKLIDRGHRQVAFRNRNNAVPAGALVAQFTAGRQVKLDGIAVIPFQWGGNDRLNWRVGDLADDAPTAG